MIIGECAVSVNDKSYIILLILGKIYDIVKPRRIHQKSEWQSSNELCLFLFIYIHHASIGLR